MSGGDTVATMKNKPVSFNIENPTDRQLLEHANAQGNFSGYIKRLMRNELNRQRTVSATTQGGLKITVK